MLTITTTSVNGRADWYQAHAQVGERYYNAFMSTRMGAFMEIARQLAVKGYLKF